MTPFYADDWLTVYGGDCRAVLASMPADSVDCVVTSPPYWGLRDYGSDGQLGLERTPEEYVANMVAVFAEVRRVLKSSGTCWLNLGDSYNSSPSNQNGQPREGFHGGDVSAWSQGRQKRDVPGLKPKDLVGIPWRVAFALQADGWYLRSDVIWSKPNPMPESVTDRPTKSHEYLFLLTKASRYYFDADAVRESPTAQSVEWNKYRHPRNGDSPHASHGSSKGEGRIQTDPAGRNIRSVWNIATRPYPGAHFAVFPPELPERCIKAGSSEKGVCPECGAPWDRVVERASPLGRAKAGTYEAEAYGSNPHSERRGPKQNFGSGSRLSTLAWLPSCDCRNTGGQYADNGPHTAVPAVVLDPFAGSGTVGVVANRLSRRAILIDLNPEYLKQQMTRNAQTPLGLGAA
jgi:DNA modification methylase